MVTDWSKHNGNLNVKQPCKWQTCVCLWNLNVTLVWAAAKKIIKLQFAFASKPKVGLQQSIWMWQWAVFSIYHRYSLSWWTNFSLLSLASILEQMKKKTHSTNTYIFLIKYKKPCSMLFKIHFSILVSLRNLFSPTWRTDKYRWTLGKTKTNRHLQRHANTLLTNRLLTPTPNRRDQKHALPSLLICPCLYKDLEDENGSHFPLIAPPIIWLHDFSLQTGSRLVLERASRV